MSKELTKREKQMFDIMKQIPNAKLNQYIFTYWSKHIAKASYVDPIRSQKFMNDFVSGEVNCEGISRAIRKVRETHPELFPRSRGSHKKEEEFRDHYSPKANKMIQGAFI